MATVQDQRFGVEVETTGRTRRRVADAVQSVVGGTVVHVAGQPVFDPWEVHASDGRSWRVVADSSLGSVAKSVQAEVVSPILEYGDMPVLQEVVRAVRRAGARADSTCGVHVHVDAGPHSPRSLANLLKVVHGQERHIAEALGIGSGRARYARDVDADLIERLARRPPRSMGDLSRLWYKGRSPHPGKFDQSRYRAVNLHSVFTLGTVEFRAFNSTMHAGKLRAYVTLSLALSAYSRNVRHVRAGRRSYDAATTKYDFRVFLLRLGLIGPEFKTVRMHLLANLSGSAAWRRAS